MAIKNDAKFEEELTGHSKFTWGIWRILTRALESLKNVLFNGILLKKVYNIWAKNCRGVMFHNTEEWCKIWREIDLSFQNSYEKLDEFRPELSKISKICTLMDSFWTKYIMFGVKKYTWAMFDSTKDWFKIWRKLTCVFEMTWRIW